ncbi:hypothetical protein GHHBBDOD_00161 [Aeromonas phage avDM4]|nr:hypothetical protein GHHBBDOD_00161 [Aeromonas phage avDM4]
MIKAAEMAKMVAQNSTEIVNSVSVYFDDFFNDNMKDTMIVKGGHMSVDTGQFLRYLREKQPFTHLHNDDIIKRFIVELRGLGYKAELVCPPMSPDYISVGLVTQ